ncbi:MAG: hypothetical protein HYV09_26850 [Deltaproteobacteria bacterium]|nr:hypothetical protein [Deltaproteobacteria bacterium]
MAQEPQTTHSLPLTARERLAEQIPVLLPMLADAAKAVRARGWDDGQTLSPGATVDVEPAQQLLAMYARAALSAGHPRARVFEDTNLLGRYIWNFLNFELHHRKLFWVDESLAWMLTETRLDIEGRELRLPFPSFALAFADRGTLEVAEACLRRDQSYLRDAPLRIMTVHVTRVPEPEDVVGLELAFFFDDGREGAWPYLVARSLHVRPSDHLERILASRPPGVDVDAIDDIFRSDELGRLVHLVINAILFTTSCEEPWRVLSSPVAGVRAKMVGWGKKRRAEGARLLRESSSEEVYHLPGKIPIAQVRALREARRTGGQMFARFMVRGHWRRAQASWEDQRVRWIEPYWKGPDMATVVEREYVLKK